MIVSFLFYFWVRNCYLVQGNIDCGVVLVVHKAFNVHVALLSLYYLTVIIIVSFYSALMYISFSSIASRVEPVSYDTLPDVSKAFVG
jgi:hypothetical protein